MADRPPLHPEIATYHFEHARDILLVIDADTGVIVDANEAACEAYGYPIERLLGLTILEIRAADPAPVQHQIQRAVAEGLLFETIHQRSDGSTFPVEVNSRGHALGDRRVLLSVVRDISERRRHEAERDSLIATTRRALEQREEFLVIASHELRSPITNISLQLQQLLRLLDRSDSHDQRIAATTDAIAEVTRLSALISMLLDAQAAARPIVLDRGPVELSDLIGAVVARLKMRARAAGSELTIAVPSVRGEWDRLRLDQVFGNLLVNALKYGRGRPIDVTGTIADTTVEVAVRDRGIGISESDQQRIFDKFERAVPAAYGGLGLGLYITRQLVEAHGGTISLESTPGEGSTFRVLLPR